MATMGKKAQWFKNIINHKKHYIIEGGHPSTLGGNRSSNTFFGRNFFHCANEFLQTRSFLSDSNARPPVDWALAKRNALAECPPQPKPEKPEKPPQPNKLIRS